jgi:hypothetical protein
LLSLLYPLFKEAHRGERGREGRRERIERGRGRRREKESEGSEERGEEYIYTDLCLLCQDRLICLL